MEKDGFEVETTNDMQRVARGCNLLITATPSQQPLLLENMIEPGTHITAMGSDTAFKQELDSGILHRADLVVADSIAQCLERGEIARALAIRA